MKFLIDESTHLALRMVNDVTPLSHVDGTYQVTLEPPQTWAEGGYRLEDDHWVVVDQSKIDAENERVDNIHRANRKLEREELLQESIITTTSGNVFDADEDSQNRLMRAVLSTEDGETVNWVLADNSEVVVDRDELKEAMTKAMKRQMSMWGIKR